MDQTPNIDRLELAREISHQLKNMVTALRMGCRVLEQEVRAGEMDRAILFLTEIRKEIEAGSAAVDRIDELR